MSNITVVSIGCFYFLIGILVSLFLEHSYKDSLVPGSEDKYLNDVLRAQFIAFWPYFVIRLIIKIIEYYGSEDNNDKPGFNY